MLQVTHVLNLMVLNITLYSQDHRNNINQIEWFAPEK